ncbi:MAG: GNAT family N-acetyltransferase [Lachnospiraceae bacterium]|nr:GNAT family N-acetyltransferase [Lachnospiraceae bacterium]
MKKTRTERRAALEALRAGRAGRAREAKIRLVPYETSLDGLIRTVSEDDLAEIRGNGDVYPETVLLALCQERPAGVGYLSRGTVNDGILTVYCVFDVISSAPGAIAAGKALLRALKGRFASLKPKLPFPDARLTVFSREESETAAFLQENGFLAGRKMSVFRNGLNLIGDVPETRTVRFPDGSEKEAHIGFLDVTVPENMERYIRANGRGFGHPDSEKGLLFRVGHWQARVFAWLCGDEVLAAVTVWPQRGIAFATEDVFCVPEVRRQGLTEQLLKYLLRQGKEEGYACADLNAFSHNMTAVRLYEKCGYVKEYELTEFYVD